jgi:hypothetical protein
LLAFPSYSPPPDVLAGRSKREVVTMTSCQRPKECKPSRYRHGSDPPKQLEAASLSNFCRPLSPSSTPSSFDPFTYIRSKVTDSQVGTMSAPSRGRSLPCHRLRSLWLFHVPRTRLFLLHAVKAAIQAYRRSHVRSPEVPVDRVEFDQGGENVSRAV